MWRHSQSRCRCCRADDRAFDRRYLQVSRTLDGIVHVTGMLDPQTGAMFQSALKSLSAPRDESAAGITDIRTGDQRRVDALGEMCSRLLATGELPTSGGQRPHLTLVVDLPSLHAHTGDGLGTRSHLAGTVVLTDAVGLPLAVGRTSRTSRTVLAWQHRLLRVRDNGCVFPGCNRPMEFSQAHHVRHWSDGGPTDVDNLVMLCQKHHRLVHSRGWKIERVPDRKDSFQWRPPRGGAAIPAQHAPDRNPLAHL